MTGILKMAREHLGLHPTGAKPACPKANKVFSPPCDKGESENCYVFHLDLPGVLRDQLNVHLTGRHLTVSGIRPPAEKEQCQGSVECRHGRFSRVINLPEAVDPTKVEANLKDGILQILVAKKTAPLTYQITVTEQAHGPYTAPTAWREEDEVEDDCGDDCSIG